MGRPRKPTVSLQLHGTLRNDRHGDRANEPQPTGVPRRPEGLEAEAGKLWDKLVIQLSACGVGKEIDETSLQELCEMWGLYRKAYALAKLDPIDKEIRTAVLGYAAQFANL